MSHYQASGPGFTLNVVSKGQGIGVVAMDPANVQYTSADVFTSNARSGPVRLLPSSGGLEFSYDIQALTGGSAPDWEIDVMAIYRLRGQPGRYLHRVTLSMNPADPWMQNPGSHAPGVRFGQGQIA